MGGQVSWLIPAALVALAALLWLSRRSPRMDRTRSAAILWGGWLVLTGLVFSYMSGIIHPYYTVALAPAVGALTGIGAAVLWRDRHTVFARVTMAAMLAVTAGWAWVLLGRSPGWYPWLRVAILAAALGSAAAILVPRRPLAALGGAGRGRMLLAAVPVSLAVAAGLGGPLAYSINTAATAHTGALPSAGPAVAAGFGPGRFGPGGPGGFGGFGNRFRGVAGGGFPAGAGTGGGAAGLGGSGAGSGRGGLSGGQPGGGRFPGGFGERAGRYRPVPGRRRRPRIRRWRRPRRQHAGQQRAHHASHDRLRGLHVGRGHRRLGERRPAPARPGQPVLAIGGFNGTDPTPTLAQFERLVSEHKIHYFVGQNRSSFGGGSGAAPDIASWVEAHFTAQTVGGVTVYDLACTVIIADGWPPVRRGPPRRRRQPPAVSAASFCSTISPSIWIWISSLTTSLPSRIALKLRPKSFLLILVVAL